MPRSLKKDLNQSRISHIYFNLILCLPCTDYFHTISNGHFSLFFSRTMTGIEYELLHVQDPILYVIRKQHRISPTQGQLQQIIFSVDYFDLCQENKIILYAITDEHSSLQKYNRWRISTGRKQTSLLQLRSWTRDSLEQIQLLVRAEWGVGLGKRHTLVLEQDCISGTLTAKPHCLI